MRFKSPICRTLAALCCWLAAQGALAQAPATAVSVSTRTPMIDVHSHFQADRTRHFPSALRTALAKMDELGIARTLLMPPPLVSRGANYYDIEELRFAAQQHPDRVAIMGGSSLNVMIHDTDPKAVSDAVKARFRARVDEIVAQGAVGFGELGVHHVSIPAMGSNHAYESVPADHPLLLLLADLAAERGLPIDLHMDLVPETMPLPEVLRANRLNPDTLAENAEAFKRLLSHNPKARFVWSHVGFEPLLTRHPQRVRQWLKAYPNLYMSFRVNKGHPNPAAAMTGDGQLKPAWVALIGEFPDRLMLGSDAFYDQGGIARGSGDPGQDQGIRWLRSLVDALPAPLAEAVASRNALRLYKLPDSPPVPPRAAQPSPVN